MLGKLISKLAKDISFLPDDMPKSESLIKRSQVQFDSLLVY